MTELQQQKSFTYALLHCDHPPFLKLTLASIFSKMYSKMLWTLHWIRLYKTACLCNSLTAFPVFNCFIVKVFYLVYSKRHFYFLIQPSIYFVQGYTGFAALASVLYSQHIYYALWQVSTLTGPPYISRHNHTWSTSRLPFTSCHTFTSSVPEKKKNL